jgi:L-histidine N-alpha-methyltransferase
MTQSFTLIAGPRKDRLAAFARDVRAGLTATPKYLSCCYFYDRDGSQLFEEICVLPEYYLTRAEREILQTSADELVSRLPAEVRIVEFGSGSSSKTRHLLSALLRRQRKLHYVPIDICSIILQETSLALLREFPDLQITALAMEYHDGLRHLKVMEKQPQLILWLGSNVGNFHRPEAATFLRDVRALMAAEDRLLMGVDLRKDRAILEPAYDDAAGVTAEFNLNILARINRELKGDFDLDTFRHRAIYNEEAGRIEMYLVSTRRQSVAVRALELTVEFGEAEAIHTENSYKYSLAEIDALGSAAGFRISEQWFDSQRRFCLSLLAPHEVV